MAKTIYFFAGAPLMWAAIVLLMNAELSPMMMAEAGCILNCSFCKGDPITDLINAPLDLVMPLAATQGCNCDPITEKFQCPPNAAYQNLINLVYQLNYERFCKCQC